MKIMTVGWTVTVTWIESKSRNKMFYFLLFIYYFFYFFCVVSFRECMSSIEIVVCRVCFVFIVCPLFCHVVQKRLVDLSVEDWLRDGQRQLEWVGLWERGCCAGVWNY